MKYLFVLCVTLFSTFAFGQAGTETGTLGFTWSPPVAREDGSALALTDIGGFELRCKRKAETQYKNVVIPDRNAKSFVLTGLSAGEYECAIASYDINGLYSRFVAITPKVVSAKPNQPANVTAKQPVIDVVAACVAAAPNCRVAIQGEWQ